MIKEVVTFLQDVIDGKLKVALRNQLFFQDVPPRTAFSEVEGAFMVKGNMFGLEDGQAMFHRLVPLASHKASALYR